MSNLFAFLFFAFLITGVISIVLIPFVMVSTWDDHDTGDGPKARPGRSSSPNTDTE